jgi:hypothetical protein
MTKNLRQKMRSVTLRFIVHLSADFPHVGNGRIRNEENDVTSRPSIK